MANWTTKRPEEDGVYFWVGITNDRDRLEAHGPYIAEVHDGKLPWMGGDDLNTKTQDQLQDTQQQLVAFFKQSVTQPELPEEQELQKLWDREQENDARLPKGH